LYENESAAATRYSSCDIYETIRLRFMKIIRNYSISRVFMRDRIVGSPVRSHRRFHCSAFDMSRLPYMTKLNGKLN